MYMRLQEKYKKKIAPKMMAEYSYKNIFAVPKLTKAVINVGFGRNVKDKVFIDNVMSSLTRLEGQKPILTKAKKSISAFKIKQGMIIGAMVSLRGKRMYDFVEKLIHITFPRVKDFRGLSENQLDKQGNLTIGIRENLAFPEINADEVDKIHSLEVCLNTTANDREPALALFKLMGFPFKHEESEYGRKERNNIKHS